MISKENGSVIEKNSKDEMNAYRALSDFEPETGVRLLTSGLVLRIKGQKNRFTRNRFRTDSILLWRNINYKLLKYRKQKKEIQYIRN